MHVGSVVVLLLVLSAGCVRHKPHAPAPDSVVDAKRPAETQPVEPAPPAAKPAAPVAPRPAGEPAPSPPQTADAPTPLVAPAPVAKPATPPQAPVVTAPAPRAPTVAKPAAPASPEPPAKATASAPSSPAPKQAVPSPAPAKPTAPPAPSATRPAPPVASKANPPAAPTPAAAATLDLDALKEEVKSTSAIGFFSKITLKNQVDDLLDDFRAFHQGKAKLTTIELRRSYELLLMKVLSLVQDKDPRLASSIVSSRETIWNLLVDPKKFATLQG